MTNKSHEYQKILDYLESQEIKGVPSKEIPRQEPPKIKQKKVPPKKEIPVPKEDIKTAREATRKLMEEASYTYVPGEFLTGTKPTGNSKGFDVQKFESLMRSKLIDNHKRIQSYERPYISVSELIGCLRQAFYSRLKYQVDLKQQFNFSYLYLIQKIGNVIHDIFLNLYDFSEIEKPVVSETYKVKGRVDGIRGSYVHELKSIDEEKFENKFIYEHYLQALIYAYILNTEYDGYKIDTVTITYIMRSLKRIVPFDVSLDNKLAKSLLERSPTLLSSIKRKQAPDPLGANDTQCRFCLYKKYCEKDKCENVYQPFSTQETRDTEKKKKKKSSFQM